VSTRVTFSAAKRLASFFDQLRRMALDQNPLANSGVTGPQLELLNWMANMPNCGVQDIAAGLGLTSPTVSVGVRKLEAAGLVKRQPDPEDGRAIQLFLTERGQTLYQRACTFREEKIQKMLAGLTLTEANTLLALLEKAIGRASGGKI